MLWLDWAKRNVAPVTSGSYVEGRWKLLIHTTESYNFYPGSTYYGTHSWPHFTIERDGTTWQHIDMDIAARALKNLAGGVETNRSRVIQIENCAKSGDAKVLTDAQVVANRRIAEVLHQQRGMELYSLPAGVIGGSASVNAPQRMSYAQWRAYSGICAHRHAPENEHWDSGAQDLSLIVPIITPPVQPVPEEDYMIKLNDGPSQYVRSFQFMLNRFFTDTGGEPGAGWVVKDGVAGPQTFAAAWEAVLRLSAPQPGFALTAQVDLRANGITDQGVLEREGIDPVLIAAITAAAGIR